MVRMENCYPPPDRIQELCQSIEKYHLSYLEMEESPEKIIHRSKLEDYIHDFLCVTPHYQKFTFTETEEVLRRSASIKKDFSAYKASTGFNAIQLYAGNLLSQPWRKEYRTIKAYCGFYKHQIEAILVDAELLFEALGYDHIGEGILVLSGPICSDRVVTVSRDCLIAYVECQILKAIWEEVSSSFKISWLEVLEFRQSHICTPEQAIKELTYKHHQRQYQEHTRSYSQGCDPFAAARSQNVPLATLSPVVPLNHSFPPLSSHHRVGLPTPPCRLPAPPPEYLYGGGCCSNSYANTVYPPPYAYLPFAQSIIKQPQLSTNGYYCNGYMPPIPPPYQHAVPTAKLIEVESHNGASHDVVDKGGNRLRTVEPQGNVLKNNILVDKESGRTESQFENWDYVYRNLESQGYSKDLGERGDVLNPNTAKLMRELKKVKTTNLDDTLNNLAIGDRPLKINEALNKLDRPSPPSSYENLTPDDLKRHVPRTPVPAKTKTVPRERSTGLAEKQTPSKTLEIRKPKEEKKPAVKQPEPNPVPPPPDRWQCKACTYINNLDREICEICSKSRNATTEPRMEIGGAECSQCTLVNPKNLTKCEACNASLKDSPTYI